MLSVAWVLLALVNVALWLASDRYWIAGIWSLAAALGLWRAIAGWNRPPQGASLNPLRDQLAVGSLLFAGVIAWWFLRAQS
jgi:hypothetical protein